MEYVVSERMKYFATKYANDSIENIIVFRSGPHEKSFVRGMDYADNARALSEYMVEHGYCQKYHIVWLVKNPKEYSRIETETNISFVSFDLAEENDDGIAEEYYYPLLHAKYIFFTDAYGFANGVRPGQIRVQLWHGCGFKTRVNFSRCEDRYEYTIVISELYKEIHTEIYGLREDQVLVTGYPKHDWLYRPYSSGLSNVLGIHKASKFIFWMPTFRMAKDQLSELNQYEMSTNTGLPIVDSFEQMIEINKILQNCDTELIIKLHPFQKAELINIPDLSNIKMLFHDEMVEKDLVINRMLADADALISDYSSAAVDYLNLDRPIAFTIDDIDEYEKSRGFVFNNIKKWLPGVVIRNYEDLCFFITEVAEEKDSGLQIRHEIGMKMLKYCDDNNCRRVIEAFDL